MAAIIVLVDLKEGVDPEDYEIWVRDSYAPAILALDSVDEWRNYRATGLLGTDSPPPHHYVVVVDANDPERLRTETETAEFRRLLEELHGFADLTQITGERFF